MKTSPVLALLLSLGASALFQPTGSAAEANSYQVTGPVVSIDDTKIVVQKGKENWELNRKATTTVTGGTVDQIKPGTKVTIHYTMDAASMEIKAEKPAAKTEKPAKEAPAVKAPAAKPSPKTSGTATVPKA